MARIIIASPNRVDADFYPVTFSGGSWQAALPLTNLRDPLMSKVARSTGAALASTTFDVDLGAPRDIRIIGIPAHNLSRAARIKIRGASDALFADVLATVDWRDVWQVVYPWGTLPWGDPSFVDGKISAEAAVGYRLPFVHVFPAAIVGARYWRFELDDTGNADGYVELARLFLAPGYQPTINAQYGAQIGWENETSRERSLAGADFFDERSPRRVLRVTLAHITMDELYAQMFEMQRRQGVSKQVFVVLNADDAPNLHRTSFPAYLRDLDPIELAYFQRGQVVVDLVEAI